MRQEIAVGWGALVFWGEVDDKHTAAVLWPSCPGNKGIRDAGSTADFRILFEILKIWKILEHLENFRTFRKFGKVSRIWKTSIFFRKFMKFKKKKLIFC